MLLQVPKQTQGWWQRNQLSLASETPLEAFTQKQRWILRKLLTDKIGEHVVLGICFCAQGNKNGKRYLKHFSASQADSWNSCYLHLHLRFPTMKIKCIATGKEIFSNLSNPKQQECAWRLYYALNFLFNLKCLCSPQQVIYFTKISNPFKAKDINKTMNQKTILFTLASIVANMFLLWKIIFNPCLVQSFGSMGGESDRTWKSTEEAEAVWEKHEKREGRLQQWFCGTHSLLFWTPWAAEGSPWAMAAARGTHRAAALRVAFGCPAEGTALGVAVGLHRVHSGTRGLQAPAAAPGGCVTRGGANWVALSQAG